MENLIEALERLPGIGPKSAARLGFYLLRVPESERQALGNSVLAVGQEVRLCDRCFNISESELCEVCEDSQRDPSVICVVEDPLDLIAFEKTGKYRGLYHVLHGVIAPLEHIGPDNLKIAELIARLKSGVRSQESGVKEVILALNPSLEGEATAMYIKKVMSQESVVSSRGIRITRLASGIPTGGDLEYADALTLTKALEGRQDF
ncbi:recombination protein RecR [candidate division WWE3 bacterium RIFCSPLOWO2_01_FULL_53_14]|uniref:Recombination protein RecR n=1 Tax=candidate division WWE3 bacterium RIFCSPLOWO2_01_FULL_53_14 TaxID=1802628 RepID=A0A1F4VYV4_UNCKA|nr:MAG: recombination protein RecR [candidate division WWE3 bacterium RIFCSPLOWO2_01_FULL_53_14]